MLIVSVGTLALLLPTERAFLLAAVSTLVLLGQQTFAQLQGITTGAEFAPVGILGAVIFVITAVVQLLRTRLVESEALAEQRGIDLRNLVELNDYIIQHLRESIVVVDGENHIRLINESAVKQLSAPLGPAMSISRPCLPELAAELRRWRSGASVDRTQMAFSSPDGTNIQPHFAPLSSGRDGGVVIFLEDTSLIAERVQQAKLAALGRLSASIAHEIRNPLGAMSHAGQLLAESPSMGKDEHRLTDIIRSNARRVSQIVESVLALSRREAARPESLQLDPVGRGFHARVRADARALRRRRGARAGPRRHRSAHGPDALASDPVEPLRQRRQVRQRRGRRDRRRDLVRHSRAVRQAVSRGRGPRPGHQARQGRADLRAVLHEPAGRHGPRPLYFTRARGAQRRRVTLPTARRAAAVRFASCSPIRSAGSLAKNPYETDRTRRRRRTPHLRALVDHARAHGYRDAHVSRHHDAPSKRSASRRSTCASPTCAFPTATGSSSSSGFSARCPARRSP